MYVGASRAARLAVVGPWAPPGALEFLGNPGFGQNFKSAVRSRARTDWLPKAGSRASLRAGAPPKISAPGAFPVSRNWRLKNRSNTWGNFLSCSPVGPGKCLTWGAAQSPVRVIPRRYPEFESNEVSRTPCSRPSASLPRGQRDLSLENIARVFACTLFQDHKIFDHQTPRSEHFR